MRHHALRVKASGSTVSPSYKTLQPRILLHLGGNNLEYKLECQVTSSQQKLIQIHYTDINMFRTLSVKDHGTVLHGVISESLHLYLAGINSYYSRQWIFSHVTVAMASRHPRDVL